MTGMEAYFILEAASSLMLLVAFFHFHRGAKS